jgi:hypothetical protein
MKVELPAQQTLMMVCLPSIALLTKPIKLLANGALDKSASIALSISVAETATIVFAMGLYGTRDRFR